MVYKNFSTSGTTAVEPDAVISPTLENDKKRSAPHGHWQRFKKNPGRNYSCWYSDVKKNFQQILYSHGTFLSGVAKFPPLILTKNTARAWNILFSVQNLANVSGNTIYIHRLETTDNEHTPSQKFQFTHANLARQAVTATAYQVWRIYAFKR